MRITRRWMCLGLGIGVAAFAGCSKAPTAEIEQAKQAIQDARAEDAATYSPQDMTRAEDAMKRLDAELELQQEKFALFRSYKQASALASEVKTEGAQAVAAAETGRVQARDEATLQIAETQALLVEVRAMLAKAPKGKGSQGDIALMQADLDAVDSALADASASLDAGDYREAQNRASAAKESVELVQSDIATAIEMRGAARRK